MKVDGVNYRTVRMQGYRVLMIDQNLLPHKFKIVSSPNYRETANHIKIMTVRGAGCIGSTAGYAMAQAFGEAPTSNIIWFMDHVRAAKEVIEATRPTASNLKYATERVFHAGRLAGDMVEARRAAFQEAEAIANEDVEACKDIGEHGAHLIQDGMNVLTHCNAGWLAFTDYGSASAPIWAARDAGRKAAIFAGRTGPRCQGSRLTAWEYVQEGVPVTVFDDSALETVMRKKNIGLVITGTDRVAANGDVANKIGTRLRAMVAKELSIPFYVALPTSTIDLNTAKGDDIPIEYRDAREVLYEEGRTEDGRLEEVLVAAEGARAINPAFDITPAELVTGGLITEQGIVEASEEGIKSLNLRQKRL